MPRASAICRASSAGSWPKSSPSGRLLTIVRTPDWAKASISARPSAPVVHRSLLHEIVVLDHLLDVVGDVGAEIAAAQRQFPDRHLGVADVEQHQALHVVDVVHAEPVELELDDLKKMPVKPLDQRN